MRWGLVWGWLQTWKGAVPAVVAVLAAIYYGPRKILETWDWYIDRFRDNAVMQILERNPKPTVRMDFDSYEPSTVEHIAEKVRRSPSFVRKSLRRLEVQKRVAYDNSHKGWWPVADEKKSRSDRD
jgi:hypothetical protein